MNSAAPVAPSPSSRPGLGLRLRAQGAAPDAGPRLEGFRPSATVRCARWEIDRDTIRAPNQRPGAVPDAGSTVSKPTCGVVLERRHRHVPSRVGRAAVRGNITCGWQLRQTLDGEVVFLASSPRDLEPVPTRDRGQLTTMPPASRLLALVGCLPMVLLTPFVVHAAPPSLPPAGDGDRVDDPTAAATPPAAAPPATNPPVVETEPTAPTPAPAPPSSGGDDGVSLAGVGLWEHIVGQRVRITVQAADGAQDVEGELISQSAELLALSVDQEGRVITVRKADVLAVHVDGAAKADRWGQTGAGLLIGGGAMIGVGVPLIISAISFGTYGFYGQDVALGFGIPGALLVAGGIPMVVFGAKRQKEHRREFGFASARPNLRVGKDGAVAGVSMRF